MGEVRIMATPMKRTAVTIVGRAGAVDRQNASRQLLGECVGALQHKNASRHYGLSSPLWDCVLGTAS